MGIIDTTHYTIQCESCGNAETTKIHDKGDRHSGSYWQSEGKLEGFDSSWTQKTRMEEPRFVSATCKKCGGSAKVQNTKNTQ